MDAREKESLRKILECLRQGDLSQQRLIDKVELSNKTTLKHLTIAKNKGFVERDDNGLWRITREGLAMLIQLTPQDLLGKYKITRFYSAADKLEETKARLIKDIQDAKVIEAGSQIGTRKKKRLVIEYR